MRADLDRLPISRRIPGGPVRPGPWHQVLRALMELGGGAGELLLHSQRDWASATFAGSRHRFTLDYAGMEPIERAEDLIAALPDHEFRIPGQIVADAAVVAVEHRALPEPGLTLTCELLLLAED